VTAADDSPSASGSVPWRDVFGNDHPVEVEIGPGRGDVLLATAAARPGVNFFAIERLAGAAAALAETTTRRGLANLRVIAADARCVIQHFVTDASVTAYHIYFPDPWPKNHHRQRRLARRDFALALARSLAPGGALHLASDLPALVDHFDAHLRSAGLVRVPGAVPPPDRPTTRFERKYARAGTHYARFVRGPRPSDGRGGAGEPAVRAVGV
jgi:tRNA (guanine-N7-)-methyltransferase